MKINEITESMEINPKHRPFIQMAHKIRAALEPQSGIKWDDEEFNKAAQLTSELVKIGASFGPKTPAQALKNAGYDVEEFKALIQKTAGAKVGTGVADPEANDDTDDMDRSPSDDEIARKADMMARG
jgi:hypothetical protein